MQQSMSEKDKQKSCASAIAGNLDDNNVTVGAAPNDDDKLLLSITSVTTLL